MPSLASARPLLGWAAASLLWLPAGIVALSLLRGFVPPLEAEIWASLIVTMPCGVPLVLACLMLARAGRRPAAWKTFAVLGPLTVLGGTAGGVLGPWGVVVYTAVFSLPAWIFYGIVRWRRR